MQIKRINELIHHKGFTLACLRNLLVQAPCWNIFDFKEKSECPAYRDPHTPCYKIREGKETSCPGPSEHCAIYLNRKVSKVKILEK